MDEPRPSDLATGSGQHEHYIASGEVPGGPHNPDDRPPIAGVLHIPPEMAASLDAAGVAELLEHLSKPAGSSPIILVHRGENDVRRQPWWDVLDFVVGVFDEQQAKHGAKADSLHRPTTSNLKRLRVLMEEVGEVAELLDDDDDIDVNHLRVEVAQVASVALAWLEGLHPDARPRVAEEDRRTRAGDHVVNPSYAHDGTAVEVTWSCGRTVRLDGNYPPRFYDERLIQLHGDTCPEASDG